jgi:hypothetical protein
LFLARHWAKARSAFRASEINRHGSPFTGRAVLYARVIVRKKSGLQAATGRPPGQRLADGRESINPVSGRRFLDKKTQAAGSKNF